MESYDYLPRTYRDTQRQRIESLRVTIANKAEVTAEGRVIPEDADITIGTGRRLQIAVLFLDISGFSQRPGDSLPEQDVLLRVVSFFFTEMIRIVEDYGGTVEKNTGDGLMAYFEDGGGDPPAIGSKRAVACALTMLRTNDEGIAPVLMATRVDGIRFRIGIDYGAVTIANVGAARRFGSIVAVGTSANIASKMLAVAEPDQIVVGEDVVRQLPQDWMRFCHPLEIQTGFSYRTGDTYRFFEYTGRWAD